MVPSSKASYVSGKGIILVRVLRTMTKQHTENQRGVVKPQVSSAKITMDGPSCKHRVNGDAGKNDQLVKVKFRFKHRYKGR